MIEGKLVRSAQPTKRGCGNNLEKKPETTYLHSGIHLLLFISVVFSPLIYYAHVENFSNLPKNTFIQGIGCILVVLWLLKHILSDNGSLIIRLNLIFIWLSAWVLFSGLSLIWAVNRFSGLVLWLHWFIAGFYYVIIATEFKTVKDLDRILLYGTLGAILMCLLGFAQYYLGFDLIPQVFIPAGTFSNRNVLAQYIIMVLPFTVSKISWDFGADYSELICTFASYQNQVCLVSLFYLGADFLYGNFLNWLLAKYPAIYLKRKICLYGIGCCFYSILHPYKFFL